MNTTTETGTIAPEVQEFLAAVRSRLSDLDPDEQRDITEGLEADLADLVAERGRGALGDPVAYARELRAAAGLEPEMVRSRERLGASARVHWLLDGGRREWGRLLGALPGDAPGFLGTLRPVWWVLRGWLAVQVAAMWLGDWSLTIVPGGELAGVGAVLLGVLLSIQLGRGRLWPADGWHRIAGMRLLLVLLNCFAVAMIPAVGHGLGHGRNDYYTRGFDTGYRMAVQDEVGQGEATDKAGMYVDGKWVSNVYPYDAQGRPLVGVQLFDQIGRPISVITQPEYTDPGGRCVVDREGKCSDEGLLVDAQGKPLPRVFYPWTNGATQVFNVFPLPSRVQAGEVPSPTAFTEAVKPAVGPLPLASVPQVSLPGIQPSEQRPTKR
jgi:hypothetical protein